MLYVIDLADKIRGQIVGKGIDLELDLDQDRDKELDVKC